MTLKNKIVLRLFTLLELLIVIAIIGLIAGLLMPSLAKARNSSKRTYCNNNLRNISTAIQSYLNKSDDLMPVAAQLPSANLNSNPRIVDVLSPEIDNATNVFKCPSDDKDYFEKEGSSYEYNSMLCGRKLEKVFLAHRIGASNTPVMYDYETFHGAPGTPGAMNYLFLDGHVGDLK